MATLSTVSSASPSVTPVTPVWPSSLIEAMNQTKAVVSSTPRTFGSTASRMVTNPQGIMSAFARELLASYADSDGVRREFATPNEKAIGSVGYRLAQMMHSRLQNNGLTSGMVKEDLSVEYTWRDILASQVGVIQVFLGEMNAVAKSRPESKMIIGVRYWQQRYVDTWTAGSNSLQSFTDLADELMDDED